MLVLLSKFTIVFMFMFMLMFTFGFVLGFAFAFGLLGCCGMLFFKVDVEETEERLVSLVGKKFNSDMRDSWLFCC